MIKKLFSQSYIFLFIFFSCKKNLDNSTPSINTKSNEDIRNEGSEDLDFYDQNNFEVANQDEIGNKAFGLIRLKKNIDEANRIMKMQSNVIIPDFFCIPSKVNQLLLSYVISNNIYEAEINSFKNIYKKALNNTYSKKEVTLSDLDNLIILLKNKILTTTDAREKIDIEKNIINIGKIIRKVLNSENCFEYLKNLKLEKELSFKDNLLKHLKRLNTKKVSIRSSSLLEDRNDKSAAGYFETIIGSDSQDLNEIIKNIIKVFSSAWTEKILKIENSGSHNKMGIIIQSLFPSQISGIVYSKSNLDPTKAIISLGPGQGEFLVSGKYSGSMFSINRQDLQDYIINEKQLSNIILNTEDEGKYNEYLYIDENGNRKHQKFEIFNFFGLKEIAKFLCELNSIKNKKSVKIIETKLEEVLKRILIFCFAAEQINNSFRDQEIGISLKNNITEENLDSEKDIFDIAILQDRTIPQVLRQIPISEQNLKQIVGHNDFINQKSTPLSNGIGYGKVIEENDFFDLMNKSNNKDKFILFTESINEDIVKYFKNISGIICKNGTENDHISNECNNAGVPIIRLDDNYSQDFLKNQYVTLANVLVDGKPKSIILKNNHLDEILAKKTENISLISILKQKEKQDEDFKNISNGINEELYNFASFTSHSNINLQNKSLQQEKFSKIPFPSNSWSNYFQQILKLNAINLKISFSSSLNDVLNFDISKFENNGWDNLNDYFNGQGLNVLNLLLNNLKNMIQCYLTIYDIQNFKEWETGFNNLINNIFQCIKIIQNKNIDNKNKELAFSQLRKLILDNGVDETSLNQKVPSTIDTIQEFIRYIHRKLYNNLSNFLKDEMKNKNRLEYTLDNGILEIGKSKEFEEDLPYFIDINKNLSFYEKKHILKLPNTIILDIALGEHSLELLYSKEKFKNSSQNEISDSNRMILNFRDALEYSKYMRMLFVYFIVDYYKKNKIISNNWKLEKPNYGSGMLNIFATNFDFKKQQKELELVLNVFKNTAQLDVIFWKQDGIDPKNSFEPLRFNNNKIEYDENFLKILCERLKLDYESESNKEKYAQIAKYINIYISYFKLKTSLEAFFGNDLKLPSFSKISKDLEISSISKIREKIWEYIFNSQNMEKIKNFMIQYNMDTDKMAYFFISKFDELCKKEGKLNSNTLLTECPNFKTYLEEKLRTK